MSPRRNPHATLPMTWLDKAVTYLSPAAGLRRVAAKKRLDLVYDYRGAEHSRLRSDWVLGTSDPSADQYELRTLRERSRDLNRNDAVASAATDTMSINIVGRGLQPQSRIRPQMLGITEARAVELQRQAEIVWQTWAPHADSGCRLDFDEIQFLALRKIVEDGEVIALPVMLKDPWREIRRAVELLESDRLIEQKQPLTPANPGIELGERGEPVAYHILKASRGVIGTESIRIQARDKNGRPNILHVFQSKRPGQLRGIPHFAPVISLFKDLGDYMEAEVVAARVAACLAVFVTRADAYSAAYGAASTTESGTSARLQTIEPGLVNYLEPGEAINVVDPKRPGDSFGTFVEDVLRMIGMALQMPYELLVKDFSKTNYSSARAALLEGRRMFTTWRSWFSRRFCQPIYDLVLEEAYLRGLFDAPDFYRYRSEYTRALWIGGGWGWVDPVKEVEASRMAIDYGLSTLAEEAAGQGRDWEELLEQRSREEQKIKNLGLDVNRAAKQGAPNAETTEERE